MVEQILLNLTVNSRDAMPAGGRLAVSTRKVMITPAEVGLDPEKSAGPCVVLCVSDEGEGISPEDLPRIFEPFFTTKEVGKGTGLGLATVYGIVKQHRGWIEVESEPDRGATFRIFLPGVSNPQPVTASPAVNAPLAVGTETVLVVEDETAVRELVVHLLKRCGYDVLAANSGVDALEVWELNRDRIDLLLTDLVMPQGVSGLQLAERLREQRPGLKVLYSSGYSTEAVARGSELTEGVNFLRKPYEVRKLAQAVRTCLDLR
jgi:CheY-like chemotaxis protein